MKRHVLDYVQPQWLVLEQAPACCMSMFVRVCVCMSFSACERALIRTNQARCLVWHGVSWIQPTNSWIHQAIDSWVLQPTNSWVL
eukprot:1147965-Pelagomonas_calceolata.AAC.5